jgi:hypothetical protein
VAAAAIESAGVDMGDSDGGGTITVGNGKGGRGAKEGEMAAGSRCVSIYVVV